MSARRKDPAALSTTLRTFGMGLLLCQSAFADQSYMPLYKSHAAVQAASRGRRAISPRRLASRKNSFVSCSVATRWPSFGGDWLAPTLDWSVISVDGIERGMFVPI